MSRASTNSLIPDARGQPNYSPTTGLVYIFNLIVGTGALTIPKAFNDVGWALGSAILVMLAFMSYLTATFVIESMAAANAVVQWKRIQSLKRSSGDVTSQSSVTEDGVLRRTSLNDYQIVPGTPRRNAGTPGNTSLNSTNSNALYDGRTITPTQYNRQTVDEKEPLISNTAANDTDNHIHDDFEYEAISEDEDSDGDHRLRGIQYSSASGTRNYSNYYEINEIIEMGKMASLFFNRWGRTLFYICITIYLYGDLAIYGAAVAKSLRDVACTYTPANTSRSSGNISDNALCWQDTELTRIDAYRIFLAVFTIMAGPFGFFNVTKTKYLQIFTSLMRWLAFTAMVTLACIRLSNGNIYHPKSFVLDGIPNMFGVCVYSFMCHHSLPSLVTPIRKKKNLFRLVFMDYFCILVFYFLLAFTAIFAFDELNDLYTLNFQPNPGEPIYKLVVHYFLSLFPVFTLSTSFPIIAITLRNNLKALFLTEGRMYSWCTRQCVFPLLALIPPVAVAFATTDLEFLVGITGSYAGAGIQYVVPAFLVYCSRKQTQKAIGIGIQNHHSSWFKHTGWVIFVQLWAAVCIFAVTWNHIAKALD